MNINDEIELKLDLCSWDWCLIRQGWLDEIWSPCICDNTLREYVNLPKKCHHIWVKKVAKPTKKSLRVEFSNHSALEGTVDGDKHTFWGTAKRILGVGVSHIEILYKE